MQKKCYFIVIFKHRYYKIHKKFYKYLDHIAGVEYKFRRNDLASSLSLHIGMKFGLGIFFSLLEPSIPWLPMDNWLQGCNPARPVLVDRWWKETALYWYTSSSKKMEIKLYFYVANFSTWPCAKFMHTVVWLWLCCFILHFTKQYFVCCQFICCTGKDQIKNRILWKNGTIFDNITHSTKCNPKKT